MVEWIMMKQGHETQYKLLLRRRGLANATKNIAVPSSCGEEVRGVRRTDDFGPSRGPNQFAVDMKSSRRTHDYSKLV